MDYTVWRSQRKRDFSAFIESFWIITKVGYENVEGSLQNNTYSATYGKNSRFRSISMAWMGVLFSDPSIDEFSCTTCLVKDASMSPLRTVRGFHSILSHLLLVLSALPIVETMLYGT